MLFPWPSSPSSFILHPSSLQNMEKQLVAIEKRSEEVVKKEALLASKTAALETWEKVGGGGEG